MSSSPMRDKLAVVLGPQQAAELEAFTRIEQLMQASHQAVQGNSTTAQQGARMGLLGHKSLHSFPLIGAYAAGLHGGVVGMAADLVLQKVLSHIDKAQAARIAQKLVSNKPEDLQAVLAAIGADKQAMINLRRLTQAATAAGSAAAARPDSVTGSVSYMPQGLPQRAAGGKVAAPDDDERKERIPLSVKERHRLARQAARDRYPQGIAAMAKREPAARAVVELLFDAPDPSKKAFRDAVGAFAAKQPEACRNLLRG
jgi:hypothetical protein